MPLRPLRPIYAAAIIERPDHHLLIARPVAVSEQARVWIFPRGRAAPNEAPEAAMRRIARTDLGVSVEVVVGQPPFLARLAEQEVELRYFFCGITSPNEPRPGPYEELRWVSKPHLQEYDFDAVSEPVVEWLLEQGS